MHFKKLMIIVIIDEKVLKVSIFIRRTLHED